MRAGPIVVGSLLQNRNRFCVPIYQRHYVWTKEKQWEPFWSDIRTKAIERLAGRERRFSHFMGAVVLEARGGFSARRVPSFQVVDGQHRLTTFQLFLAAARDDAAAIGHGGGAETIATYLLNRDPHLMEEPEIEIFKVWPTQFDRALFTNIINNTGGREALKKKYIDYFYKGRRRDQIYEYSTVPSVLRAYGYFYERLRHSVETDDLDDEFSETPEPDDDAPVSPNNDLPRELKLDALWQSLVEEFKVVEIVLEDGDDAQVIFETLNERGEPVLAPDLVRNNIFHRADGAKEKPEKLFEVHWKPFEDPFWSVGEKQGRYKKPRIEFFLSNFIAGQIASEANLSKLFSEYKAFNKAKKYPSVATELEDIGRYGAIYRELVGRTADTALATFSRKLLPWDVTTVFPLVMRLWASEFSEADKEICLDTLLSFIVRRAVCGLTTKNYNKLFLSVIAHLDKAGWSTETLVSFLLTQKSETGRFPRDDEFEQKWLNTPLYTAIHPARTRALLEELELIKRGRFHETASLAKDLTVEHVMPREWSKYWPLDDGTQVTADQLLQAAFMSAEDATLIGQIVRRNRLRDTLGNLTLLTQPLNSSVSRCPYPDKREALRQHSLLVLNREVTQNDIWDESVIAARGKALFPLALGIWPLPALTTAQRAVF